MADIRGIIGTEVMAGEEGARPMDRKTGAK